MAQKWPAFRVSTSFEPIPSHVTVKSCHIIRIAQSFTLNQPFPKYLCPMNSVIFSEGRVTTVEATSVCKIRVSGRTYVPIMKITTKIAHVHLPFIGRFTQLYGPNVSSLLLSKS
jgi:hypothetical protein